MMTNIAGAIEKFQDPKFVYWINPKSTLSQLRYSIEIIIARRIFVCAELLRPRCYRHHNK